MTSVGADGMVRFRFFRPGVSSVAIAADFNDWSSGALEMQRDAAEGWWVAETQLEPGEYRFRYLADGRWFTDFASHGVEYDKQGWNGVLLVPGVAERHGRHSSVAA